MLWLTLIIGVRKSEKREAEPDPIGPLGTKGKMLKGVEGAWGKSAKGVAKSGEKGQGDARLLISDSPKTLKHNLLLRSHYLERRGG